MCKGTVQEATITTQDGEIIPIQVFETEKSKVHQWQVRYVDLGERDVEYRECGKVRPCLIVSSDEYNDMIDAAVIIIPMSKSPMYNCVADQLMGLRLPNDPSMISILCFNQIQFVHKSLLQNVVCEDVVEAVKVKVMEYLYRRFGMGTYLKEISKGTTDENVVQIKSAEESISDPSIVLSHFKDNSMTMNPSNINMLSIVQCNQILHLYDMEGIDIFKDTPHYNEKTVLAAIKRCKARVSSSVAGGTWPSE